MSKWKFMQIEPQPARGTLAESMWDDPNYVSEVKWDGIRLIGQFMPDLVRFTTRRVSDVTGLFQERTDAIPHLSRTAKRALGGTVLDMECVLGPEHPPVKGAQSKAVQSILNSSPAKALVKQKERGLLRVAVFDCLYYKGEDLRGFDYLHRHQAALEAVGEWGNPCASVNEARLGKAKRKHYEQIVAAGGEGVILKAVDHRYGDEKKWIKVKKQATADCVIMGYKDAKETSKKSDGSESMTKYAKAGLIGAVVVGQYAYDKARGRNMLVEVATVSGMDDALRAEFTRHGKKHLGDVVEIEHNGREPTGRFRHPRFNRFRPDKAAIQCGYREGET